MQAKLSLPGVIMATCLLTGFNNVSIAADAAPAELKILHINDHHSHLDPERADLMLGGAKTRVNVGGFASVVSKFNELAADNSNVLKLHAGDAITGDLYYTLFKGEADAAMMNQVCFDAFALGNHEFDSGDAGLKTFLDFLNSAENCNTPALAANVMPEVGVSPLAMNGANDYIKSYIIKEVDGQQYGIIGIDIANKTKNSSNPDDTTRFLDETITAQTYIDVLKKRGVNKIILLTHYQYGNDLALAQNLSGVDVIVGGDSHSLLGDKFGELGLNSAGPYPTEQTNKDGDKVCIAQAWQYGAVVGELNVSFDADGKVTNCAGTPHLLLADSFKRKNSDGDRVELEGDARTAVMNDVAAIAELSVVTPDADTAAMLKEYTAKVQTLQEKKIGTADANLCLERIPGQGKSSLCDAADTAAHGSDITNIVAKAFLEMSNTSHVSIQNGGGVRVDVPAGDITIATAYKLLPFANTLVELDMTGQQIIDVLEEAITYALDEDGSTGAYPYAAGLRWNLDMTQPAGQRFSNVEINPRVAGEWQAIDPEMTYKVVTNSFTGGGRDGYLTFGKIADDKRVDTFLDYAQSFVNYVERETAFERAITKLPMAEYSTQQFTPIPKAD